MISKFLSKFFSSISTQSNPKKFRLNKKLIALASGITIYVYLYETDYDYLVDEFPRSLPVTTYRIIPFCWLSRQVGRLADIEIPVSLREPIIGSFVKLVGCDLSEAKKPDIVDYKSVSDLFQRQLRWDSRPIDLESDLTSPCDGTVLHFGRFSCQSNKPPSIEQVKGVNFTLKGFLGSNFPTQFQRFRFLLGENFEKSNTVEKENINAEKKGTETDLFYCTLYLAPGDYHRFHSPADCYFQFRRYFSGKLLSVNPRLARILPGLFSVNERAAYFGDWKYGVITLVAVGATNVGNLEFKGDPGLPTNKNSQYPEKFVESCGSMNIGETGSPITWDKVLEPGLRLKKGQLLGKFIMGSTIVIIFEGPSGFQFTVKDGDKVKMGTSLGSSK